LPSVFKWLFPDGTPESVRRDALMYVAELVGIAAVSHGKLADGPAAIARAVIEGRQVIATTNDRREGGLDAWVFTREDLDDPSIPAVARQEFRRKVTNAGWLDDC